MRACAAALVFLVTFLATLACGQEEALTDATATAPRSTAVDPQAQFAIPPAALEQAKVVRVIDGDTIEVELNGRLATVRYIGVDTPETKYPTRGVEPYGTEASERNRQLVEGKTVSLEKDVSETDRYGRLLRYVYVDGVMVNAVLVQEGYAQVATYPPDVKYQGEFLQLRREAQEEGRGLWAGETFTSRQEEGASVTETFAGTGQCDASYPTVCITPRPPDLDCGDISYRRFKVLAPDPHRFDGDRDGVGCER